MSQNVSWKRYTMPPRTTSPEKRVLVLIVDKLKAQNEVMGGLDINIVFSYAGLPFDKVEESFTLFSKEVLPALHEL